MSSAGRLRASLVSRAASAWIALGAQLEGPAQISSVDIEGLVAATAWLGDDADARVRGVALDWCVRYGSAVSGTRLVRVAREMGADLATAEFASLVAASGGPRWPIPGARGDTAAGAIRDRVHVTDLASNARLAWRLRAAFGTSSRADILLALLESPVPLPVAEIARRARYTKHAIAVAVDALALAAVVEVTRVGREDRVSLAPGSLLGAWAPARQAAEPVDWPARWRVGIVLFETLRATAKASVAAAAVERRVAADALRPFVIAGRLPRIDTAVLGLVFASEFERWGERVADDFEAAS